MNNHIEKALKLLKQGEVIICPTESSYGLTCDATNQEAIKKIHKIKQEPEDKPLIIATSHLNQLNQLDGILNQTAITLSEKFHPGQLNLIIPATNSKTLAFRIPAHPILLELSKQLNKPLTTTSANIHNHPPVYSTKQVKHQFQDKVSLIIEDNNLNPNTPVSTIYDTINNKLIRQGLITMKQIQEALK